MSKDIQAFTVYGNGLLPVLTTDVNVRHAESLCNIFQLKRTSSQCKAIWDTGATNTAISKKLASKLNLKIISTAECDGINTTILTNIYKIDLVLPNKIDVLDGDVLFKAESLKLIYDINQDSFPDLIIGRRDTNLR